MSSEASRLATLHSYGVLDTPPDPRIDHLVIYVMQTLGMPMGLVTLVDEHRQWFKSAKGLEGITVTERSSSMCNVTIRSDDLTIVDDARQDERFLHNPLVEGSPEVRFYAGAPLKAPNGARVGALCLLDRKSRTLESEARRLLAQYADIVAALLTSSLSYSDSSRKLMIYADRKSFRVIYANLTATALLAPTSGILHGQSLSDLFSIEGLEGAMDGTREEATLEASVPVACAHRWTPVSITPLPEGDLVAVMASQIAESIEPESSVKGETRKQILDAAKRVLALEGAGGFSMRKVAKESEVGLGHVQYYFPSKAKLIRAMVDSITVRFWQHYEQRLAPIANPMDRFVGCAQFILNSGPEPNMVLLLREFWSMAQRDAAVSETIYFFYEACRRLAASILKEANPKLSDNEAQLLAAETVSLISGAFLYTESLAERGPLPGFEQYLLARLVRLPWSVGC